MHGDRTSSASGHCHRCCSARPEAELRRRDFLAGVGMGGALLTGLAWSALAADEAPAATPARQPLVVKPVFTYPLPTRQPQTSWRNWGGIQSEADVQAESQRIQGELERLKKSADFPLEFRPLATIRNGRELKPEDVAGVDAILLYSAGDGGGDLMAAVNPIVALKKDTIFFVRHKSGPLYYWYEGVMARFLHQHTDNLAVPGVDYTDVVVDSLDEVLWRLRALAGLRNTRGRRILAVGGPGGWETPDAPRLARERFNLDIQTVGYQELGELIRSARGDKAAVDRARRRAEDYLKQPGTTLDTKGDFVDNAFLLDDVFRRLMARTGCQAMTINSCMSVIMPLAETTACLALSTLNDDGYLAFCESDFVAIPSGILLGAISGRPVFLQDPTYPHDDIITLAHCTGPRKMDGRTVEPARVMTHFESDYGAAPRVAMRTGQKVTMIAPDFAAKRWLGMTGEIVGHGDLPICRCQIDVKIGAPSKEIAARMPGFHWVLAYGDYAQEIGYALRRVGIEWDCLG